MGCASPSWPRERERRQVSWRPRENVVPGAVPEPLPHFACILRTALGFWNPEAQPLNSRVSLPAGAKTRGRQPRPQQQWAASARPRGKEGRVRAGECGCTCARARVLRGRGGRQARSTPPPALPAPCRRPSPCAPRTLVRALASCTPNSFHIPSPLFKPHPPYLLISHCRSRPKPGEAALPLCSPRHPLLLL